MRIANYIDILTFVEIESNVISGRKQLPGGASSNVARAYLKNPDARFVEIAG